MLMTEKLPDILPLVIPLCTSEVEQNKIAREYNSLNPNDSRRKDLYESYKSKVHEAFMD